MGRVTLRITGTQLLCQDEHPSLLAALESHNVEVEYQCREGYCGSCRTRLVAGQVDWITEPLAFIQPGEILPAAAGQKAISKSRCNSVQLAGGNQRHHATFFHLHGIQCASEYHQHRASDINHTIANRLNHHSHDKGANRHSGIHRVKEQ